MHLYLYDAFLSDRQYRHQLIRIETRLTDLGIGGKISRISPLKNLRELIQDEVGSGVRTVVAVGGDATFITIVNEVIRFDAVTLGFIPVGPKVNIALALGIPFGEAACDVIAARRISRLDVGRANNTYFLSGLTVPASQVTLELDGRYQIMPNTGSYTVSIRNLKPDGWVTRLGASHFNPSDGRLEAVIEPPPTGFFRRRHTPASASILPCRRIKISSPKSVPVLTDGERVLKTPVAIEVVPAKLQVIVGKTRVF